MTGTEENATVRVVVADDQRVVREGLVISLSVMPGVKVVGAAADGEQAVALVARYRPQVVLMDLRMPRPRRGGGHPPDPGGLSCDGRRGAHHLR